MGAFGVTGLASSRRRGRAARLALAFAASLVTHAWLAWELPAGGASGGGMPRTLNVRLVKPTPLIQPAVAAETTTSALAPAPRERLPRTASPKSTSGVDAGASRPIRAVTGARPAEARADSNYYAASELDVYPRLLTPLAALWPRGAAEGSRRARARIMVWINAAGGVEDVKVMETEPEGELEQTMREALAAARFSAGRRDGRPVRSRVLLHVSIDATAATGPPAHQLPFD